MRCARCFEFDFDFQSKRRYIFVLFFIFLCVRSFVRWHKRFSSHQRKFILPHNGFCNQNDMVFYSNGAGIICFRQHAWTIPNHIRFSFFVSARCNIWFSSGEIMAVTLNTKWHCYSAKPLRKIDIMDGIVFFFLLQSKYLDIVDIAKHRNNLNWQKHCRP